MLALQREREFRKQARDIIRARLLSMKRGDSTGLGLHGDGLGKGAAAISEDRENERANPDPLAPSALGQEPPKSV